VIGMNSILIYMSGKFIDWGYTTNGFFRWLGQLVVSPVYIVVMPLLCNDKMVVFILYV